MAAKKKTPSAQPRPAQRGATNQQKPVDVAARMIRNMYRGTNVLGQADRGSGGYMGRQPTSKLSDFVQEFQDVVAESSLVDRFSSRTLDAAAKKVATEQYAKYVGGTEDKAKARKKKK